MLNQTFYDESSTFIIYTSTQIYHYEILAAYPTTQVSQTYTLDFKNPLEYIQYINYVIEQSKI